MIPMGFGAEESNAFVGMLPPGQAVSRRIQKYSMALPHEQEVLPMKLRKRIFCALMAVLLVTVMAIPASAYYYTTTRDADGCTVGFSGVCSIVDYSTTMEYMSSDTNDPMNYLLKFKLVRTTNRAGGRTVQENPEWSVETYHATSISRQSDWTLYCIDCTGYINGYRAGSSFRVSGDQV